MAKVFEFGFYFIDLHITLHIIVLFIYLSIKTIDYCSNRLISFN